MSYRDPDLLPADVPRLKKFTKYECPVSGGLGHSSTWTGALGCGQGRRDHLCVCGEPLVEVVEDGNTYRVTFETIPPHDVQRWHVTRDDEAFEWHTVTRDSTNRRQIEDQYETLTSWAEREPIRNVRLFVTHTEWKPVER